jgi:predicted dehydrogenase
MIKIGIIGMGNIGKRHLQSLQDLKIKTEVFCHDIFKESLASLDDFLKENSVKIENVAKINDYNQFINKIDDNTIVIIATTAKGRFKIITDLLKMNPKALIIEKPVCQSLSEYESLLNIDTKTQLFVNFPRHLFPIYISLKEELSKLNINQIEINTIKAGIGCNGTHMLDLMIYLLNIKEIRIINSNIYQVYETNRKSFFDFSGKIEMESDRNIRIILNDKNQGIEQFNIETDHKNILIYEPLRKLIEVSNEELNVKDFEVMYQSKLTAGVIESILDNKCKLPTLKESFLSHQIIFKIMKEHGLLNLNIT